MGKFTAAERFLKYVCFETTSNESSGKHPSASGERVFARALAKELTALGLSRVRVTREAYVFAELPATAGCEDAPVLGWIAHLDTSDAASGKDVRPQIVSYRGGDIPLGKSGKTLSPAQFPELHNHVGEILITSGGDTLLGADDKAGIAEIMTALERLIVEARPHGEIRVAFTPDEEIGEGARFFDVASFGARYAYTMDGGAAGEIEYCNFNAAQAKITVRGVSVHPGSAKGILKNAQKIGFEFDAMLPAGEVPEETENKEGFYFLAASGGTVSEFSMTYLLRDHDAESFARRKEKIRGITALLNEKYGADTVSAEIIDQYRNMAEIIEQTPFLIELAADAVREAGLEPSMPPIRGGTDGAMLSFRGLPCPNLGTGGYNFHGEYEFASVPEMDASVEVLLHLAAAFGRRKVPVASAKAGNL